MNIKTNPKKSYYLFIECYGLAEYEIKQVEAENEKKVKEWAKSIPLPHQRIKKIIIKENSNA